MGVLDVSDERRIHLDMQREPAPRVAGQIQRVLRHPHVGQATWADWVEKRVPALCVAHGIQYRKPPRSHELWSCGQGCDLDSRDCYEAERTAGGQVRSQWSTGLLWVMHDAPVTGCEH